MPSFTNSNLQKPLQVGAPSDPSLAIEVRELRKSFRGGRDQVLKGVSLPVVKGKLTYLLGSSGSGKSVLLKHILGLLTPDSGEILVMGKKIPYENRLRLRFAFLLKTVRSRFVYTEIIEEI